MLNIGGIRDRDTSPMNNLNHPVHGLAARGGDSPFTEFAAVDAWDAWFRWRDRGALRDVTVDATWDRIATALVSVESPDSAAMWKRRFTDAFGAWRLLLDERILATAGTGQNAWNRGGLSAALNVSRFVRAPMTPRASFDQAAFEELAALAVRALDDAVVLGGIHAPGNRHFRIGIIGLADALALLGIAYDAADGCVLAALIGRSLARGCHRGSSQLARERGALSPCNREWQDRARTQEVDAEIVVEAANRGIRHDRLTAIASHPRLALFANNVADALDPFSDHAQLDHVVARDSQRAVSTCSHAAAAKYPSSFASQVAGIDCAASVAAQLKLRAAMCSWIDEAIDYPLLFDGEPDERDLARWAALATDLGLPKPRWHRPVQVGRTAGISSSH
ncbi:MAG: hypothetical protein P4L92_11135 [Rudaea sp.]|nr:hypothetical protein [Rudaea sp.]